MKVPVNSCGLGFEKEEYFVSVGCTIGGGAPRKGFAVDSRRSIFLEGMLHDR